MLPNKLLNEHLDNVAVRLRNPKPFTPNDFPAVQRYERAIEHLPVEHAYGFDSTGMPIHHEVGTATNVNFNPPAQAAFDAPLSIATHNHPANPARRTDWNLLSNGDLMAAAEREIAIRAVAPSLSVVNEYIPSGNRSDPNYVGADESKIAFWGRNLPKENPRIENLNKIVGEINKSRAEERQELLSFGYKDTHKDVVSLSPQYDAKMSIFPMSAPDRDPVMASDSFAIRRVPTADEANAVLGVIPTPVRGASQSAYVSRHASPQELEALRRSPSTGSTTNAYDPDAIHRAKMNAAASQGKWNGGGVYGSYGYRDW